MAATMPDFGRCLSTAKPTPLDAPFEMRGVNHLHFNRSSQPAAQSKSNKPRSPPRDPISLMELGWTDPIATYSKYAEDELFFLLQPYANLDAYGKDRIRWHQEQCPIMRVTDFFLFIEQHAFFLLLRQDGGHCCLAGPRCNTTTFQDRTQRCPSQLNGQKGGFHQGMIQSAISRCLRSTQTMQTPFTTIWQMCLRSGCR